MSKTYTLDIKIAKPFGNLFRKEHVLVAAIDSEGKILVGAKPDFLPNNMTRLLGGGVKTESPILSAVREMEEEMNIQVKEEDLTEIFSVKLKATDSEGKTYENTTYVYTLYLKDGNYKAGDDVSEIVKVDLDGLKEISEQYANFGEDDWYKGVEGEHRWMDYGQLYSPIHMWVYDYLKENIK